MHKSVIFTLYVAAAWSLQAQTKVALTTGIPEAMFIGTEEPLKVANLERVEVKQKPLLVPAGLTNLAKEKQVTASDDLPVIGDLEYITDGDKDAGDGSYVELGPQKQWVQIDLEDESTIYGIWLWHFHKNPRAYVDVVVQVSNDENFADGKEVTIYNADHDNSSKLGKGRDKAYVETNLGRVIDAKETKGRYVRLYSNGNSANDMNHYIEVEVWGKK